MTLTRRKVLGMVAATAMSLCAAAGAAVQATAADFTLRMHHFLPGQANVPQHVLKVWSKKIEEQSEGRIKIQEFPAMQLGGKPPELYDQVVDGVADIIWTLPGYTPGRFPRTEVFELPFIMTNSEATSRAYWTLAQETMMGDFKDVHLLALWVHGPGVIHSKKPVNALEDLKGVKLRAPTRITNSLFQSLGATPVGMPVPAVPEALSKGVVDATVLPWEVTGAFKIPELVNNHTMFDDGSLYTATFVLAMNKDVYNNMPRDLQQIIDDNSGLEFSAFAGSQTQYFDVPPYQATQKRGNNIIHLSGAATDQWREASKGTVESWVKEMDEKGMDGSGLIKRARDLIAQNTK